MMTEKAAVSVQSAEASFAQAQPRLSVILCTYNRCNMVLTTLASLRRQTIAYAQFEVIVVDNGSTDGTQETVQRYIHAGSQYRQEQDRWNVHCLSEPHNGLAYARRTALQIAAGEILVFLDDDTITDPYFLEYLLAAYDETGADAVGGCVELRWEAARPYWLTEDLLDLLGYFMPGKTRMKLPEPLFFSSCSFSVRSTALQSIGGFTPGLSKRLKAPLSLEIEDLCRRLRQANYELWYDPRAIVLHRIPRARLERAFLLGRAYWQARSEIIAQYTGEDTKRPHSWYQRLQICVPDLLMILHMLLFHRPLLRLTRKPSSERLVAAMTQAYHWGRLQQHYLQMRYGPFLNSEPHILLIKAPEQDVTMLTQQFQEQDIHHHVSNADLALNQVWRYRRRAGQTRGIIHCYQPGAFALPHWHAYTLLLKLQLAQWLGIVLVSSDTCYWWQYTTRQTGHSRRHFIRRVLRRSRVIFTYASHPEQSYHGKAAWQDIYQLPEPGLRGTLTDLPSRIQARQRLGLPANEFVYLCLAPLHTEHEITQLIDAFTDMCGRLRRQVGSATEEPQLLLVGKPQDGWQGQSIVQYAALNSSIHIFLEAQVNDLPTHLAAVNALVLPGSTATSTDLIDSARLFYTYERIVIFPDLPHLREAIPAHGSVAYDPAHQEELAEALLIAQTREYHHSEQELAAFDDQQGWQKLVQHIITVYQQLLT